ncbi:hypothetical protein HK097_004177, partial [Rhizophlyctis rosea]
MKVTHSLAGFGLFVQTCNVAYGTHHAHLRPTKFNVILVLSIFVSALSFIPLLLTTRPAIELAGTRITHENKPDFWLLDVQVRTFTAMYSVASLTYILMEQIRFRLVKYFLPYSDKWDYLFVTLTLLIWTLTTVVFGVIHPITPSIQTLAGAAWTSYGLLVDNLLSFTLMHQILSNRQHLSTIDPLQHVRRLIRALALLCATSWVALAVFIVGNFLYPTDGKMRTLFFRVA